MRKTVTIPCRKILLKRQELWSTVSVNEYQ